MLTIDVLPNKQPHLHQPLRCELHRPVDQAGHRCAASYGLSNQADQM